MSFIGALLLLRLTEIDPIGALIVIGILLVAIVVLTFWLEYSRERRVRLKMTEVRLRYLLEKKNTRR